MAKGTLVIGIGREKPSEYTDEPDADDAEGGDDDAQAGADAAKALGEALAAKDWASAYDAFETLTAICKGKG